MTSEDDFALFEAELEESLTSTDVIQDQVTHDIPPSKHTTKRTPSKARNDDDSYTVVPERSRKRYYRSIAGDTWEDVSLADWPENDFRIFVGNLSPDVTDTMLSSHFSSYSSFYKAKVVRGKGFGFVSLLSVDDYLKAMKEKQRTYLGLKPIQLKRSDWKKRNTTKKEAEIQKQESHIHRPKKKKRKE
ncbi:hypothetical protein GEMRC1_006256 [Eukaryota sp. GEM-RC1]